MSEAVQQGSTERTSMQSSTDASTAPAAAEDPFWEFISKDMPAARTAAATSAACVAGTSIDAGRPETLHSTLGSGDVGHALSAEHGLEITQTQQSHAAVSDVAVPEPTPLQQQPAWLPPPQTTGLCSLHAC